MVDELDERLIDAGTGDPRGLGADHPAIPLRVTVPVLAGSVAYTIASEDRRHPALPGSPKKLVGYTGLCPIVRQSGDRDLRGPLTKTARSTSAGRSSKPPSTPCAPRLRRARRAQEATAGPPTRRQGRPDRPRQAAHRSHLAHPHQRTSPSLRLAPPLFAWPPDGPRGLAPGAGLRCRLLLPLRRQ